MGEKAKLIAQIAKLKKYQNDEKEVMEELMNQPFVDTDLPLVNVEKPLNEFFADALLVPMAQVSLKEVEIKELKYHIRGILGSKMGLLRKIIK